MITNRLEFCKRMNDLKTRSTSALVRSGTYSVFTATWTSWGATTPFPDVSGFTRTLIRTNTSTTVTTTFAKILTGPFVFVKPWSAIACFRRYASTADPAAIGAMWQTHPPGFIRSVTGVAGATAVHATTIGTTDGTRRDATLLVVFNVAVLARADIWCRAVTIVATIVADRFATTEAVGRTLVSDATNLDFAVAWTGPVSTGNKPNLVLISKQVDCRHF